jgi:hypothetical protein
MNPDFSEPMDPALLQIERELQSLTPATPGRDLLSSLQARMEPVPRNVPAAQANKVLAFPWRRVVTPAAAAAAAVAVMSFQNHRRTALTDNSDEVAVNENGVSAIKWEPMPMRSEIRAFLDAGYVLNENFEPVQPVVMNRVDHYEWRNPMENASLRVVVPRPQRFLVPAGYEADEYSSGRRRLQFQ